MRVLYINPFSQEISGPDESLRTLLGALIPLGIEAHVVLPRPGPQVPRYQALGVTVHYAPLTILKRRPGAGAALLPFHLARGVVAIARIIRRERIDLVHTNMEVVLDGAVASRILRIPHVLHYRGNTNDEPKLVFDALTWLWIATADLVFCISNATAEIFRKRGLGAKVESLYNPVDVDTYANAKRSDEVRRELGAGPGDLLVGTIGRIHPRKDIETFIRAAALLGEERADSRFVVVGSAEGPDEVAYEERLREVAARLGIANRLVWAGARRDMPEVMKALDVFLLCSLNEGFGRVAAEALAARTRVVASSSGALPELLAGADSAATASPGNPQSFVDAISAVLAGPVLRCSDVGARFSRVSIAERVASHYRVLTHQDVHPGAKGTLAGIPGDQPHP